MTAEELEHRLNYGVFYDLNAEDIFTNSYHIHLCTRSVLQELRHAYLSTNNYLSAAKVTVLLGGLSQSCAGLTSLTEASIKKCMKAAIKDLLRERHWLQWFRGCQYTVKLVFEGQGENFRDAINALHTMHQSDIDCDYRSMSNEKFLASFLYALPFPVLQKIFNTIGMDEAELINIWSDICRLNQSAMNDTFTLSNIQYYKCSRVVGAFDVNPKTALALLQRQNPKGKLLSLWLSFLVKHATLSEAEQCLRQTKAVAVIHDHGTSGCVFDGDTNSLCLAFLQKFPTLSPALLAMNFYARERFTLKETFEKWQLDELLSEQLSQLPWAEPSFLCAMRDRFQDKTGVAAKAFIENHAPEIFCNLLEQTVVSPKTKLVIAECIIALFRRIKHVLHTIQFDRHDEEEITASMLLLPVDTLRMACDRVYEVTLQRLGDRPDFIAMFHQAFASSFHCETRWLGWCKVYRCHAHLNKPLLINLFFRILLIIAVSYHRGSKASDHLQTCITSGETIFSDLMLPPKDESDESLSPILEKLRLYVCVSDAQLVQMLLPLDEAEIVRSLHLPEVNKFISKIDTLLDIIERKQLSFQAIDALLHDAQFSALVGSDLELESAIMNQQSHEHLLAYVKYRFTSSLTR